MIFLKLIVDDIFKKLTMAEAKSLQKLSREK